MFGAQPVRHAQPLSVAKLCQQRRGRREIRDVLSTRMKQEQAVPVFRFDALLLVDAEKAFESCGAHSFEQARAPSEAACRNRNGSDGVPASCWQ